jgi:hypothetical protein
MSDPHVNAPHCRGRFFAVINEGDPVPLAQKEYILALLEVYAKASVTLLEEGLDELTMPDPVMKLSGDCVLLRDEDPDNVQSFKIGAYSARAEVLQSKLFGNPLEHFIIEYLSRVYCVLELEASNDKEMDIDI